MRILGSLTVVVRVMAYVVGVAVAGVQVDGGRMRWLGQGKTVGKWQACHRQDRGKQDQILLPIALYGQAA
ncbi:MAG: hypothetical protein WED00_17560 [Aquisalimonadaceae bacterium]